MGGLKTQHRFLLENAAAILNRPVEYVLVSSVYYEILSSVLQAM